MVFGLDQSICNSLLSLAYKFLLLRNFQGMGYKNSGVEHSKGRLAEQLWWHTDFKLLKFSCLWLSFYFTTIWIISAFKKLVFGNSIYQSLNDQNWEWLLHSLIRVWFFVSIHSMWNNVWVLWGYTKRKLTLGKFTCIQWKLQLWSF